jgi:phage baseplate assembly protein gpV
MTVVQDAVVPIMPSISVDSANLTEPWYHALIELRVERGLRSAGRALLRFRDDGLVLASTSKMALGAPVDLGASRPGAQVDDVLLKGVITGVSLEQDMRGAPELVVTVHDRAYSLGRGAPAPVAHLQTTASTLVSGIAGRHGLTASSKATSVNLDYLLHHESDLELLDRLADQHGYDWWVDGRTLHFKPVTDSGAPGVTVELGSDLVQFTVRASGLHPDKVTVTGWDPKTKSEFTSTATAGQVTGKPDADLFMKHVEPKALLNASSVRQTATPSVTSQAEADALAEALRDDVVHASLTASGRVLFGSRLVPGTPLTVKGPRQVAGTYVVTSVEHVFRDGFTTRFTAGDRRPSSLVETLRRGPTASRGVSGLVVGLVTNLKDPDSKGKVKVKYVGRAGDQESHWARVLSLGAGPDRGLVVQPEVDDEVLLGFEGGDLRRPVVLGGLFSGTATVPDVGIAESVRARSLTSRLGHKVELSDGEAPDQQHVLVELAGRRHRLRLGKDAVDLEMPAGVPFTLKVGSTGLLAFDDTGALTIKAASVKIESTGPFSINGKATVDIKATGAATVEGMGSAALKSNGMVQVQAVGIATLKGATVAIN